MISWWINSLLRKLGQRNSRGRQKFFFLFVTYYHGTCPKWIWGLLLCIRWIRSIATERSLTNQWCSINLPRDKSRPHRCCARSANANSPLRGPTRKRDVKKRERERERERGKEIVTQHQKLGTWTSLQTHAESATHFNRLIQLVSLKIPSSSSPAARRPASRSFLPNG